jgi:hypothetical protein
VVFFSLSASIAGKWDFSPLANGLFSLGVITKLLLPSELMQIAAILEILAGVLIYFFEVIGFSAGHIKTGGILAGGLAQMILWGLGYILAIALGYMSKGLWENGFIDLGNIMYSGRSLGRLLLAHW